MKYESELIKEIVDTKGHEKPLLHYETECIESWIDEAKGAYPKLTDYRGEWLNYMVENPIGVFPYITLSDVTDATVDNVVPYAYKSAILKGQTLVNLVNDVTSNEVGNYTSSSCRINVIRNLQNETLTIIFNVISLEIPDGADGIMRIGEGWSGQIRCKPTLGVNKVLYNYNQTSNSWLGVFSNSAAYNLGQRITISDVMVLEGDYTNIDIPYFEGMQSVQMPVLTTTGKNLFDGKLEYGLLNNKDGHPMNSNDYVRSQNFIPINCEKITFTVIKGECGLSLYFYDKDKNFISYKTKIKVSDDLSIPDGVAYLKFRAYPISDESTTNNLNTQIQIEEGEVATEYEPYQSNILTVNEEVTLRGIGEVKDELNCLTGELTERIGEVVLDGSESYSVSMTSDTEVLFMCNDITGSKGGKIIGQLVSDVSSLSLSGSSGKIIIKTQKSQISNVSTLKSYLSQNNLKIQYQFATESIKTVDLSITNQDGNTLSKIKPIEGTMHLTTSSDTLKPTFSGEIPVEATTQNLSSFIEE